MCFSWCQFAIEISNTTLRPFLIQSDWSVENGLFRLKPKSGFLTNNFFRLRIPTAGSSRKNRLFRLDPPVEKLSRKVLHVFFNRSHRLSHHQTHTYTATRPHTHTRYHTVASYKALTLAWLSLLLLLAASEHGALLAPLASRVYHTTAVARVIDAILPTTATPAVALAALG